MEPMIDFGRTAPYVVRGHRETICPFRRTYTAFDRSIKCGYRTRFSVAEWCKVTDKRNGIDFEKSLSELEELVERMEKGEISLEESLKDFERGIGLARACQTALKEAEQKVQVLIEKDGQLDVEPFSEDE